MIRVPDVWNAGTPMYTCRLFTYRERYNLLVLMYSKLLVFVFLQAIKVSDQSMDAATHVSKLGAVKHERGLAIAKKGFHFCFETDNSGDKIIVLMADGALNYPAATAAEASHIRIYIYIYIYI